jgi:hypothetical protein
MVAEYRNEGFRLTAGPQFNIGTRRFKLYAGASGGLYFYRTNVTSQYSTFSGTIPFSDSRDNDLALGWNFGGGFQYDIGLGPWLDVSLEYQTIYGLERKSEQANENDVFETYNITANEFTLKFGVIFFLRR